MAGLYTVLSVQGRLEGLICVRGLRISISKVIVQIVINVVKWRVAPLLQGSMGSPSRISLRGHRPLLSYSAVYCNG